MKIGVPKEIKPQENRIGLTPESVKTLTSNGHEVLIENNGGFEAGFENDHYVSSGAKIVNTAEQQNKSASKKRYKILNPFDATKKAIIDKIIIKYLDNFK